MTLVIACLITQSRAENPILQLAFGQQRRDKTEILQCLLKDVSYSQQIPLEKMEEVIVRACLDHFVFCIFGRESSTFEVLNVD